MKQKIKIVSAMRPFERDITYVQCRAIENWLSVTSTAEIVLLNDERNTTRNHVVDKRVQLVDGFRRARSGVPLLTEIYDSSVIGVGKVIHCFLTADILLASDFEERVLSAIADAQHKFESPYLIVSGRRDSFYEFTTSSGVSATKYYDHSRAYSSERGWSGLDLWITQSGDLTDLPPFPIGRYLTDGWVVNHFLRRGLPVIDGTTEFGLVHQRHSKPAISSEFFEEEKRECFALFPTAVFEAASRIECSHVLNSRGINPVKGVRRLVTMIFKIRGFRFLRGSYRAIRIEHYRKYFLKSFIELWSGSL